VSASEDSKKDLIKLKKGYYKRNLFLFFTYT